MTIEIRRPELEAFHPRPIRTAKMLDRTGRLNSECILSCLKSKPQESGAAMQVYDEEDLECVKRDLLILRNSGANIEYLRRGTVQKGIYLLDLGSSFNGLGEHLQSGGASMELLYQMTNFRF